MGKQQNDWETDCFWFFFIIMPIIAVLMALSMGEGLVCAFCIVPPLVCYVLYHTVAGWARAWRAGAPRREQARALARERAEEYARRRAEQEAERRQRGAERRRAREEKVRLHREQRDAARAQAEVEAFYRANEELLRDVLPPSLFRSERQTSFPDGIGAAAAWAAARDLISRMQPAVERQRQRQRKEQERQRKRAEQVRQIDEEIRKCEAKIAQTRSSPLEQDAIEDEIAGQKQAIKRLQERRDLLLKNDG
jgi:uncharacterized membrane protein YhiD involved in acid resistance